MLFGGKRKRGGRFLLALWMAERCLELAEEERKGGRWDGLLAAAVKRKRREENRVRM